MVNEPESCLILFTRYPESGKAKTRLIPFLGPEGAAALQRQMTEHILAQALMIQYSYALRTEVHFAGGDLAKMQSWLGFEPIYQAQSEGNLGDRIVRAFQQAFQAGMKRIVIIGADCPGLEPNQLMSAFNLLHQHDLVLGPAMDGGYYLVGLSRAMPGLFEGITWGTDQVMQQTVAIAQRLNLSFTHLDPLSDVDRPEDLPVWENIASRARKISSLPIPSFSVTA
ncbi:MAG: glycosyltransferase [Cyanothece sp. SIO1E1]|nr:glycosyltransferase [Cyanothece sp. SIO1E1]